MNHHDARRFLDQNEDAAATLTVADVELYAAHHAGGLVVVGDYAPDGRFVKMHDTWGDPEDGPIVVHAYNPDYDGERPDGDPSETVAYFTTGRAALDHFLTIVNGDNA